MIASCQPHHGFSISVIFVFIGIFAVEANVSLHSSKTLFLSSSSKSHRARQGVESTAVTFNEPVTPPPLAPQTPLASADDIIASDMDIGDGDTKHPPVMLTQILILWEFLVYLSASIAIGVVVLVVYHQWSNHILLEQQAAKLQFIIVFALLIVCPASRAAAASSYSRVYWILALRNVIEMWLLLLAFSSIPHIVLDYVSRSSLVGAQQAAATSNRNFDQPKFALGPDVRRLVGLPDTSGGPDRNGGFLVPAPDKNWRYDIDVARQLAKPMGAVLAVRPLVQIMRSVARMGFGVVESWDIAAMCTGINFVLLAAAASLGVIKITPPMKSITRCLGVSAVLLPVQAVVVTVLLAAQAQDFIFIVLYGSENLAQVVAGLLFMVEIVVGLIIVAALITSDPLLEMVQYRVNHIPTSLVQKFKLLAKPYALWGGSSLDPAVPLRIRPQGVPVIPAHTQEKPGMIQRSIWRGVLLDVFADKVRSKLLAIMVLSVSLSKAIFWYPHFISAAKGFSMALFAQEHQQYVLPGIQLLFGLFFSWLCWLVSGLILMGNNICFSKWWLLVAVFCSWNEVCSNIIQFLTVHDESPTMHNLAYYWATLFCSALAAIALFESLRLLFVDEGAADFYQRAMKDSQYTSIMLENVPADEGKKHCKYAKKLLSKPAWNPPSLLVVGASATIPVVLGFAFVMLYSGLDVIRFARIGQVYYQTFEHPPDIAGVGQALLTLDKNFDQQVSPEEAGLVSIFSLLGAYASPLIVPMHTLWASVNADGNGKLGVTTFVAHRDRMGEHFNEEKNVLAEGERVVAQGISRSLGQKELHSFLNGMYRCMAVFKSLTHGDIALASQSLVEALDKNKDGTLDQNEFPLAEVALALQAVAPHFSHLVAPMLGQAWQEADADHDENLSIQELPNLLLAIKKRIMQLEKAVQDLVLSLVLSGVSGMSMESYAPAPAPILAGSGPSPAIVSAGNEVSQTVVNDTAALEASLAIASLSARIENEDSEVDDVSMLLERSVRHRKARHLQHLHHSVGVLRKRRHIEVSQTVVNDTDVFVGPHMEVLPGPQQHPAPPAAPASVPVASPAVAAPAPQPMADHGKVLKPGSMDFFVKILMDSTASLGEAFSLLLVAFDAILPEFTSIAQDILSKVDGRSLSTQLMQIADDRWRNEANVSSGWAPHDIATMEMGLARVLSSAMPQLLAEGARAKLLLNAIADGAGSPSDENAGTAVDKAFITLDSAPKDGKLSAEELGIHGVLALVNPALASHAQSLVTMATGKDGLDKAQVSTMLDCLTEVLASYVSDVNGDGETNVQDVKVLAKSTAAKLANFQEPASLLEIWQPVVLRKVVRPETDLLQSSSRAQSAIVANTGSPYSPEGRVAALAKRLVQICLTLDLDRIEMFLYAAALLSFAFGVFVVAMPFFGQARVYEQMLRGDHFKGDKSLDHLKGRLDYATAFPGILFSTVFLGVIIVFFVTLVVLTPFAVPSASVNLIWSFKITLVWLTATFLIMTFLKRVVMDRFCLVDGEVVHPRLFACVYIMLIITNFALGTIAAIGRLVFMLPFLFIKFHILSATMLDGDSVGWDGGYSSFLTMVKQHLDVSNPIRRSFLHGIAPDHARVYGEQPLEAPRPQSAMQRTRNRFWVAYMTSKVPELRFQRKKALAADPWQGCVALSSRDTSRAGQTWTADPKLV